MKTNVNNFKDWKLNEQKLRKTLVRGAGKRYGEEGFDQKQAYDDLEDTSELDDLFKQLAENPEYIKRFAKGISSKISLEEIKAALEQSIKSSNISKYIANSEKRSPGKWWDSDDNLVDDISDYGDEIVLNTWEEYQNSPWRNYDLDSNASYNKEEMFNAYAPIRVRSKK